MVNLGDVVFKIAGRDAGQLGVVVDVLDQTYVLIDGCTRKRKCNLKHLVFLNKQIKFKKTMNSQDIVVSLKELGFTFPEIKKGEARVKKERPKQLRKVATKKEVAVKSADKKKTSAREKKVSEK